MTIDLKHITVAFDYASGDIADIKRCLECLYQRERAHLTGNSV